MGELIYLGEYRKEKVFYSGISEMLRSAHEKHREMLKKQAMDMAFFVNDSWMTDKEGSRTT